MGCLPAECPSDDPCGHLRLILESRRQLSECFIRTSSKVDRRPLKPWRSVVEARSTRRRSSLYDIKTRLSVVAVAFAVGLDRRVGVRVVNEASRAQHAITSSRKASRLTRGRSPDSRRRRPHTASAIRGHCPRRHVPKLRRTRDRFATRRLPSARPGENRCRCLATRLRFGKRMRTQGPRRSRTDLVSSREGEASRRAPSEVAAV